VSKGKDKHLTEFYAKRLLIPGWAGKLVLTELRYIKEEIKKNGRLRAKWGFKKGTGKLSDEKIKLVALYGVEALAVTTEETNGSIS